MSSLAELKDIAGINKRLLIGCYTGDLASVERLVAAKADVNCRDSKGKTPLFVAIEQTHLPVVQYLISQGADVNTWHPTGKSTLWEALNNNNPDVVRVLINSGARITNDVIVYNENDIGDLISGKYCTYKETAETYEIHQFLTHKTSQEIIAKMEHDKAEVQQKPDWEYLTSVNNKQELLDKYDDAIKYFKEKMQYQLVGVSLTAAEQKQLSHIFAAGSEKDYFVRINFVGFTGAGKTSTMLQLFLQRFDPSKITSTDGIDIRLGHCIIDLATSEWKKYDKKENDELLERIRTMTMDSEPEPQSILEKMQASLEEENTRESGAARQNFNGSDQQCTGMNVDKECAGHPTGEKNRDHRQLRTHTETYPTSVVGQHINVRIQKQENISEGGAKEKTSDESDQQHTDLEDKERALSLTEKEIIYNRQLSKEIERDSGPVSDEGLNVGFQQDIEQANIRRVGEAGATFDGSDQQQIGIRMDEEFVEDLASAETIYHRQIGIRMDEEFAEDLEDLTSAETIYHRHTPRQTEMYPGPVVDQHLNVAIHQENIKRVGEAGATFDGSDQQQIGMRMDEEFAEDLTSAETIYHRHTPRQTEMYPGPVVDQYLSVRFQQAKKTSGRKKRTASVRGFDYAGQATYYALHQLFFSKRGINLIVLDASRDFHDPIDDEDARHIGGHLTGNSKDFFRYWSKLLRYFLPKSKAIKIITVFTHRDLVQDQDQLCCKKCDIQDIVEEMGMKEMFYKDIFCLNANDPEDKDLHELRHIILCLSKKADDWGQRMPSGWLLLEDKLMAKKSEGIRVMTLNEVEELNERSSPRLESREEVFLFLKVHHDIGTLIHFADEGLRNVVILDAQWLIDCFKTIISSKQFKDNKYRKEWKRLHKKGIVKKNFIHHVWKDHENERFFEFRDELILLMNTMDLISSPRRYNSEGQHISNPYYVVPCMLQKAPSDFMSKYQMNAMHSNNALSFEFEYSFLPTATVYRLLATCIMQYGDSEESKTTVYCNAAVFKVYEHHFLTLEITSSSIIANIFVIGKKCADVGACQGVREFLDNTLKCVINAQKTTAQYELSVACGNTGADGVSWLKWKNMTETSITVCDCHENDPPHAVNCEEIINQWLIREIIKTEPLSVRQKIHDKSGFDDKPTHMLLGRISRRIPRKDIHLTFIKLGLSEDCITSIDQHRTDTLSLLFEWLRKPNATVKSLTNTIKEQQDYILDIEEAQSISCDWRADFPTHKLDIKLSDATDADIDTVCLMTGAKYLELGLELGFLKEAVDAFEKDYRYCHRITRHIIKSWTKKKKLQATWKMLGDALYEIQANPEFIKNICTTVGVSKKKCTIA